MPLLRQFCNEIKILVGKSHSLEAFSYMREHLNPESSIYDDLLLAQALFSLHEKEYIKGKIVFSEHAMACTKANDALFNICKQLQEDDLLFYNLVKETTKPVDAIKTDKQADAHAAHNGHEKDENPLKNSQLVAIHIAKAKKLRQAGMIADGITELRKADALKPDSFKTKTDLASLLRQANQYDEAIHILSAILEKKPTDEHSRNELAFCYREMDKLDLAIQTLDDGLQLVETNNHFHTNLFGIHLFFTCNIEKAVWVRDRYSSLTGHVLIKNTPVREQYDDFILHFEDIHNGHANHELTGCYLGECIHSKKAYVTAAKILSKLLKANPQSFWYRNARQKLPPQYDSFFEII